MLASPCAGLSFSAAFPLLSGPAEEAASPLPPAPIALNNATLRDRAGNRSSPACRLRCSTSGRQVSLSLPLALPTKTAGKRARTHPPINRAKPRPILKKRPFAGFVHSPAFRRASSGVCIGYKAVVILPQLAFSCKLIIKTPDRQMTPEGAASQHRGKERSRGVLRPIPAPFAEACFWR